MKTEIVSYEEQKRQGLIVDRGPRFVPGSANTPTLRDYLPPSQTDYNTNLVVPVHAMEVVNVQTTERDRSAGYLMRTIPLSLAFAFVVSAATFGLTQDLIWALMFFFGSFVGAWMYGEYRYGLSSPNAAARLEIREKWRSIRENDQNRWNAWFAATGLDTGRRSGSWVEEYKGWIIAWGVTVLVLWAVTVIGLVMLGGLV